MMLQLAIWQAAVAGWFRSRATDEGASLVEYALLLALVAIVAVGALILLGYNVSTTITNSAGQFNAP